MSERQKYNRLLLEEISAQVEAYPDLRFHQILHNIDVTELDVNIDEVNRASSDKFNEESKKTYERVLKSR